MKFFHILAVVAVLPFAAMAEVLAPEDLTVGPYSAAEIGKAFAGFQRFLYEWEPAA